MNGRDYLRIIGFAGITAALTACGGGSSSGSSSPQTANGPTAQSGQGAVSGFGSVYVNGVKWETDDCEFSIDDESGDESMLAVGDIVEVTGTKDANGVYRCTDMDYDAELEGRVSGLGGDHFFVHGMRVDVNGDTIWDDDLPGGLADLSVDDYVEVSAYPTGGRYIASRVDRESDDGEVQVYGKVANLDSADSTFTVHEMVVAYAGASMDDFDGKQLANGDHVEVEGDGFNGDGELVASSVEYKDHNPYDDGSEGDEFEIEGYLEVDSSGIYINDIVIILADNVRYVHGTADDLVDEAKVEVEGRLGENRHLVAYEIKFKRDSELEIEAPLDDDPSQDPTTMAWTISVLDRAIEIADWTRMEDDSEREEARFDPADLMAGDWVEVRIFRDGDGDWIAVRLEREDADELPALEGEVTEVDGSTLLIGGFTVLLDEATDLPPGFDLASFLDEIVVGQTEIEVEGTWMDNVFHAREAEFED